MANAIYPLFKQALLTDGSTNISLSLDTVDNGPYCALVDTAAYTYNASHQFYTSVIGSPDAIVGTDQRITAPTVTNGTLDGGDLTYTSVTGPTVEALVVYRHNTGANSTWRLVMYYDAAGGGLPVTPNGGTISVTWNGSGIFTL